MIKYFPLGVFSFMTLAHTHATNTEFTRIENGILDDLYVHSQQSVLLNSLASCSAHCSQSVGCKSYTWKNATSSCVLLSTDITRNLLDPSIPQDIAVYTKYYRRCSEFGYEQIDGINGYCFKNYGVKKAYSEAQNTCRNDGGHLVRISTSTKHGHIQSFMKLKSSREIYIDGTKISNGSWCLSDGSPMFLDWRSGEPTGGDGENCVIMFDDGTYNDVFCNFMIPFMCERQLNV
nr:asialoglycoprotein receptor 2-like [Crassostrea gigas]